MLKIEIWQYDEAMQQLNNKNEKLSAFIGTNQLHEN